MMKKNKLQKRKGEKEKLLEYRQGEIAGSTLSDEADTNSGVDSLNAADDTAFPTYINEKGEVKHRRRRVVGQNVTLGTPHAASQRTTHRR